MYAELLIPKEFEDLYLKIAGDDQVIKKYEIFFLILKKFYKTILRPFNFTSSVIS